MGPKLDGNIAIALDVQIWVMPVCLRDLSAALEELDAGHKVFHLPVLADPPAVMSQVPTVKQRELLPGFF
jgi:hypothetical protein